MEEIKNENKTPTRSYEKNGRKWFDITSEDEEKGRTFAFVVSKIHEAWMMGCTDTEAALLAGISKAAVSRYLNAFPEERELRDKMKKNPVLLARTTVINNLGNVETAKWFLERRMKKEFAQRNELTGEDGEPIRVTGFNFVITKELNKEEENILKAQEELKAIEDEKIKKIEGNNDVIESEDIIIKIDGDNNQANTEATGGVV